MSRSMFASAVILFLAGGTPGIVRQAPPGAAAIFGPVPPTVIELTAQETHGAAWGDVNGDGYPDLVVTNRQEPDVLYLNDAGQRFIRSGDSALQKPDRALSQAPAWGDYDGDGSLDLAIGRSGRIMLYLNQRGRLEPAPLDSALVTPGVAEALAAGDLDRDGDLDLVAAMWSRMMFRFTNAGDGTFTVAELGAPPAQVGVLSLVDHDGDRDADLFVPRVGQVDRSATPPVFSILSAAMFENDGHGALGITSDSSWMRVEGMLTGSWGDVDNDADLDLFVGAFVPGGRNALLRNDGTGRYTAVAAPAVTVALGHRTTGSAWGDVDNDGDLDLFVAAGYDSATTSRLYLNDGRGGLTATADEPLVTQRARSITAVFADYDRDGLLDLFVGRSDGASQLYRNTSANGNRWLAIRLRGTRSNRTGIGARVFVTAELSDTPVRQLRELHQMTGYGGHNEIIAHFGLGAADRASAVRIEWPSGQVQELRDIRSNQVLEVREP